MAGQPLLGMESGARTLACRVGTHADTRSLRHQPRSAYWRGPQRNLRKGGWAGGTACPLTGQSFRRAVCNRNKRQRLGARRKIGPVKRPITGQSLLESSNYVKNRDWPVKGPTRSGARRNGGGFDIVKAANQVAPSPRKGMIPPERVLSIENRLLFCP